ncbi:hypothetical protein BC835DRAFT_694624 [Cytidiella melzeri]|nr:hypothetical protein BC835DRAFT_694624 [Cytidiella melzeri]
MSYLPCMTATGPFQATEPFNNLARWTTVRANRAASILAEWSLQPPVSTRRVQNPREVLQSSERRKFECDIARGSSDCIHECPCPAPHILPLPGRDNPLTAIACAARGRARLGRGSQRPTLGILSPCCLKGSMIFTLIGRSSFLSLRCPTHVERVQTRRLSQLRRRTNHRKLVDFSCLTLKVTSTITAVESAHDRHCHLFLGGLSSNCFIWPSFLY